MSNIAKSRFDCMRGDGQGERIKTFEIELENVLIADIGPAMGQGDIVVGRSPRPRIFLETQ